MPYYDFECSQCGKAFSLKQSFDEHDRQKEVKCPYCGAGPVERLISPVMAKTSKKS